MYLQGKDRYVWYHFQVMTNPFDSLENGSITIFPEIQISQDLPEVCLNKLMQVKSRQLYPYCTDFFGAKDY